MTLAMMLASVAMVIWNRYKVNYPFILEMDVTYKITPVDVFRFSSTFFTIWLFCYFGDLLIIKYEYYFRYTSAPFVLALYIMFFGVILLPFAVLYWRARFALTKTIG